MIYPSLATCSTAIFGALNANIYYKVIFNTGTLQLSEPQVKMRDQYKDFNKASKIFLTVTFSALSLIGFAFSGLAAQRLVATRFSIANKFLKGLTQVLLHLIFGAFCNALILVALPKPLGKLAELTTERYFNPERA